MAARFSEFMFGLMVIIIQAALFGMLALWLASRYRRWARVVGGIVVVLLAWTSLVPVLDWGAGYQPRSGLDVSVLTLVALLLGWFSGRNRRIRASMLTGSVATNDGRGRLSRLWLDEVIRPIGSWVIVLAQVFGTVSGLVGFFIELGIIVDVAGFWGMVIGFVLAPVTFALGPLYVGFQLNDWIPAAFCYGGPVAACLLFGFGMLVAERPLAG